MKVLKAVLLISVLVFLVTSFTGCTGSRILPNQLYDFFSSGDFTANFWVRGGDVLPYMQSETVYKGRYAVEFSNLQDDETSLMYIDLNIEEGAVISFYVNSSDNTEDGVLSFYIDDTLAGQWEMQAGWKRVIRELPAGEHRLKWEFENFSDENDKAWLDDIMISHLIPLGEKIEFPDDAFKQLVLSQIGKSGGVATVFEREIKEYFNDSRAKQTFSERMFWADDTNYQINKNTRYTNDAVYANEVTDIEWLRIESFGTISDPITDITGIEHFKNLLILDIGGPELTNITPISELKNIRFFSLFSSNIEDITPLNTSAEKGELERLSIINTSMSSAQLTAESIDALATWSSLKGLLLYSIEITEADFLSNLANLENLILYGVPITDISPLTNLPALNRLALAFNPIEDIDPLRSLTNLESLDLWQLPVTNIDALNDLSGLKELLLSSLDIAEINALQALTQLEELLLWDLTIENIEVLSNLQNLKALYLDGLAITDISPLQTLTHLKVLEMGYLNVSSIDVLSHLLNLEDLLLDDLPITDISPLLPLTQLKYLSISETQVKDITALENKINVVSMLLSQNLIEDITPIVSGLISTLERLDIRDNQLDLTPGSEDLIKIQKLIDAGIEVFY